MEQVHTWSVVIQYSTGSKSIKYSWTETEAKDYVEMLSLTEEKTVFAVSETYAGTIDSRTL